MKNSIVIFVLGGIFICAALVIGYIYIPKLDQENGTKSSENLVLDLPFNRVHMRYTQGGVVPFCNKNSGYISFDLKEDAPVYAAVDATVSKVDGDIVTLKPEDGISLEYSPLSDVLVSAGDYLVEGDLVGYVGSSGLDFAVKNVNDSVYECPYLYFTEDVKTIITDSLELSDAQGSDICGCSRVSVK